MEISLKNISYSVYAFFIALFLVSVGSIAFFTQDYTLRESIGTEVPNIEINNFTMYLINPQYTQAISLGQKAMRFEDHEEMYDIFINQVNTASQALNEYMYAPFVYSKNQSYTFSQGVDYLRLDGLNFWSKMGVYDYNTRIFQGSGDFILRNYHNTIKGQNIYYASKEDKIKADSIMAELVVGGK